MVAGTDSETDTGRMFRRALVVGIGWLVALGVGIGVWTILIWGAISGFRLVGR